jgi:SNF2 family DNA or RNA helicase
MPEKNVSASYHELSTRGWREYENLWDEYLEVRRMEKKRGKPDKDLVELILLRKFIAMEAIPYTIEEAENAIEQGQKVIIFTSFTDELNELADHFGNKCVIYNGPMSEQAKQNSVDEFQNNDKIKVFIGNIRAAGVGITLTAANFIIFNSFDWVPGNNEQAEDRAYRIGQKNNVTVKYQLFLNTISMRIWWTLQRKKNIIDTIMGEKEIDEDKIERKIIDDLLLEEDGEITN